MAVAYAAAVDLKSALSVSGSDLDTEIDRALDAASRGLDKLTGKRPGAFAPAESSSTRTYTAESSSLVVIDDLAELDTVTSDGDDITDDVTAEPLNAEADGEPYLWLVSDGKFCTDRAAIGVTGPFNWPAIPEQVEQWVLTMAGRLLKRVREAPFGLVTGAYDGEIMRLAREDPDTEFLIGSLRRHRPVIA